LFRQISRPSQKILINGLALSDHIQHQINIPWKSGERGEEAVNLGSEFPNSNIETLATSCSFVFDGIIHPPLDPHNRGLAAS
jgi:hypothetical protein